MYVARNSFKRLDVMIVLQCCFTDSDLSFDQFKKELF